MGYIYLAESTIPGAGMGMFAGKSYAKGDKGTDGNIIIPLTEIDWHNGHEDWVFLSDDYQWSTSLFVGMDKEVNSNAAGASPGIGAAINCIESLVNIEESYTKIDNAGLHRSKDAGAGAFTPYHDRRSHATDDIAAGQKLFISYGSSYFRMRESVYDLMPSDSDYEQADSSMAKYESLALKEMSQELQRNGWNLVTSLKPWNKNAERR